MSAKFFTTVMKPIKECQAQILRLSRDESLNHEEIIQETTFWRRQESKWKAHLPFFDRGHLGKHGSYIEEFRELCRVHESYYRMSGTDKDSGKGHDSYAGRNCKGNTAVARSREGMEGTTTKAIGDK